MNRLKYVFLSFVICMGLAACSSEDKIGSPLEILPDYELPQKGASDAVNQTIQNWYDKYGSYFIYEIKSNDVFWKQIAGNANALGNYHVVAGDPKNMEAMLQYLHDIWLQYFPDNFLKNGGIPYRVYMVDSLYLVRDFSSGGVVDIRKYPYNYQLNGNSIIIAGLNDVPTMNDYTKSQRKTELITALWQDYITRGLLNRPQEFFDVTDYATKPAMTYDPSRYSYVYTDDDLVALRNRGFIPKWSQYGYTVYSEIFMKYNEASDTWTDYSTQRINTALVMNNDYNYYMSQIFNAKEGEVEAFMQYPLVKRKWEILINYYKNNYGIDIRGFHTE